MRDDELNHNPIRAEIRSDGSVRLTGYVNAVERDSRPLARPGGTFIERVAAGAFKRAIERANGNIELRYNHDRTIGRLGENLTLKEDAIGLYADAEVYDDEVVRAAKEGRLQGWSFRFYLIEDEWSRDESGVDHRRLTDIDIDEVSILDVTPAYIATSIELRGNERTLMEERSSAEPPESTEAEAAEIRNGMLLNEIEILKLKER
ncbi:MAG: HK97 family phage prohead protease [Christensenellaceae bacterium]|nr:HK97 family phage prohead protease [Christensenellaceae bacterium]